MKNDKYTRAILTIIAIYLLWTCLKDFSFFSMPLNANTNNQSGNMQRETIPVYLEGCSGTAFYLAEPIEVKIKNLDEFAALLDSLVEKK